MPNIKSRTTAVALALGLSSAAPRMRPPPHRSSSSAPPGNPSEQALTGDTAEKVKAAALAKLPGATILRVETDEGGVYEAHVRKTDGTEAEVHVDKDFAVTSVDTRPAGGPGGPGGRGRGGPGGRVDTAALAKSLGVTEDKLQAALDKVRPRRPRRPADRVDRSDRQGARPVHRRRASRARRQPAYPAGSRQHAAAATRQAG